MFTITLFKWKQAVTSPSRRPAQVFFKKTFLKYAKNIVFCKSFINFSVPKNTTRDTHKTRKPHFPRLETKNTFFFRFSMKRLIVPKKEISAPKTTFSQAKISYGSFGTFDQKNRPEPNKRGKRSFPQSLGNLIS